MTAYDAVVVGARVAGASTALLLARAGAQVLLLERTPYGSDTLSTHGLTRAGVLADPNGRVAGVRGLDAANRTFTAYARTTIGADGIKSTVANAVDAPIQRRSTSGGAVLYGYFDDLPAEGYEWAYGAATAAGLIPTNDGQTCVFVGTSPERLRLARRTGADTAFAELFGTAAPRLWNRLQSAIRAGRLHGWSGQHGHSLTRDG